jgi:hypothetical protein
MIYISDSLRGRPSILWGGGGLICSGQDFGGHGEAANQAPHKIEGLPRRLIVAQYGEPMIWKLMI